MKKAILLGAISLALAACGGDDSTETVELKVQHNRALLTGWGGGTGVWYPVSDRYSVPAGFTHQWGHNYVIRAAVTNLKNPPADHPGYEVKFLSVMSDTLAAPDSVFETWVGNAYFSDGIALNGNGGGSLSDGTPFVCETAKACEDLAAARVAAATSGSVHATFGYSAGTSLPLVLKAARLQS